MQLSKMMHFFLYFRLYILVLCCALQKPIVIWIAVFFCKCTLEVSKYYVEKSFFFLWFTSKAASIKCFFWANVPSILLKIKYKYLKLSTSKKSFKISLRFIVLLPWILEYSSTYFKNFNESFHSLKIAIAEYLFIIKQRHCYYSISVIQAQKNWK